MSTPEWDSLTEQLREDSDPKVRRIACQKLAATRDPAVIPFLRNAYIQDDDEKVRETARRALVMFKAMHEGKSLRRFPLSERVLTLALGGLAGLFVISLVLNGLFLVLDRDDDDESVERIEQTTPSIRSDLVERIQDTLREADTLAASLRGEIAAYNDTGRVACPLPYQVPPPLQLAEIDNYTYPDLEIVAARLDVTLTPLQTALVLLQSACSDPDTQTEKVLQTATKLDQVEAQLNDVRSLLSNAITNPAPTVGPTITPLPTRTFTPEPTATPVPASATAPPTATVPATDTPMPTLTPSLTPSPTMTVSPTPTLPFPDLDYPDILRNLSRRYIVLGDLQNTYGTGMVNQWQQAQESGQTSTSYCQLSEWPAPFSLSAQQIALLQAPDVADPQLEDAVRLQQEGLDLAYQARTIYERDCYALTLAASAQQGIALAQEAQEKLAESQSLTDAIRARP